MPDFVECPHCEQQRHTAGTRFCPNTGEQLPLKVDKLAFLIKNEDQIGDGIKKVFSTFGSREGGIAPFLYPSPGRESNKTVKKRIEKKMLHLINVCKINEDETIFGLIDMSAGGKKNSCLAFGKRGAYYYNFWGSIKPGAHFISYGDFMVREVKIENKGEISLGTDHRLDVSQFANADDVRIDIVNFLVSIKENLVDNEVYTLL